MDAVAVRRPSLTVQQQQQQQPGASSDRTRLTTGRNVNADVRRGCSSSIDLRHCHGEPASSPLSFVRFMLTHWDCAQTWSNGGLTTMSEMRQLRNTVLQKTRGYCDQLMSNRKKYDAHVTHVNYKIYQSNYEWPRQYTILSGNEHVSANANNVSLHVTMCHCTALASLTQSWLGILFSAIWGIISLVLVSFMNCYWRRVVWVWFHLCVLQTWIVSFTTCVCCRPSFYFYFFSVYFCTTFIININI